MGHMFTKDGLIADPEKIHTVQEMRQPRNAKELIENISRIHAVLGQIHLKYG